MLEAQGRVWTQDLILQVKDNELLLADIETKEELECFSLDSVQNCCSILHSCSFNSILAITVRDHHHKENIFLFQCEEIGAELLQVSLEKILKEKQGAWESQNTLRNNLEHILSQYTQERVLSKSPQTSQDGWAPAERLRQESPAVNNSEYDSRFQRHNGYDSAAMDPKANADSQEEARDIEVLNHVLSDIEVFVGKLRPLSSSPSSNSKKKRKKKKNNASAVSEAEYIEMFQKVKYAFNLLGKVSLCMQEPSAPDLIHMLFSALSLILSECPGNETAASVTSPLLTGKAINLLNSCVTAAERIIWKNLGEAWFVTRAEWPNGKSIPAYVPSFSDGWAPAAAQAPTQGQGQARHFTSPMDNLSPFSARSGPQLMRVMYDFVGRNSKELTVVKGDMIEVLDQSKQWWMVKNMKDETGYIPNNILEPIDNQQSKNKMNQRLQRSSSPAEVAAWLNDQGFSKLTVKCLGVLSGAQLLELSNKDLKLVCPEEGEDVFSQLSAIKSLEKPLQ
ncbi:epidermal growth factor receptor kinase substrate 8-like protein 3 isoform X2 [Rhinatrema bivittatum]|nr:epidermal growth factor receptor kinase substrate 8-like protein 3 isoform X2 [Rhinatrema bivittatum]